MPERIPQSPGSPLQREPHGGAFREPAVRCRPAWLGMEAPLHRRVAKDIRCGHQPHSLVVRHSISHHFITAFNDEALMFADKLVKNGYATWKPGWNMEELKKTPHNWQIAINDIRISFWIESSLRCCVHPQLPTRDRRSFPDISASSVSGPFLTISLLSHGWTR